MKVTMMPPADHAGSPNSAMQKTIPVAAVPTIPITVQPALPPVEDEAMGTSEGNDD